MAERRRPRLAPWRSAPDGGSAELYPVPDMATLPFCKPESPTRTDDRKPIDPLPDILFISHFGVGRNPDRNLLLGLRVSTAHR